jgi:hypothetical protein
MITWLIHASREWLFNHYALGVKSTDGSPMLKSHAVMNIMGYILKWWSFKEISTVEFAEMIHYHVWSSQMLNLC